MRFILYICSIKDRAQYRWKRLPDTAASGGTPKGEQTAALTQLFTHNYYGNFV